MDGVLEDKRMFLTDAGLLADPLHSPPSAEAEYTHIKYFTQPGKKTYLQHKIITINTIKLYAILERMYFVTPIFSIVFI